MKSTIEMEITEGYHKVNGVVLELSSTEAARLMTVIKVAHGHPEKYDMRDFCEILTKAIGYTQHMLLSNWVEDADTQE